MVGICGVVGESEEGIDAVRDSIVFSPRETRRDVHGEEAELSISTHSDREQPIVVSDGTEFWIWGEIYDYRTDSGYVPCGPGAAESLSSVLSRLYDQEGMAFVSRLNGEFFGIVTHPERNVVHLFTDRLGRRPVFHTSLDDGLLFSSHLRTLVSHPETNTAVDPQYLTEFLAFQRTFGVKTPFEDVELFHPGAITTYDWTTGELQCEPYWRPHYSPRNADISSFVRKLVRIFEAVFDSRIDDRTTYGVLASGGSDSRLVLSCLPTAGVGFHLNDWTNNETEIARAATERAGSEFVFLQRPSDYFPRLLSEYSTTGNFISFFHEAHALGFHDRLAEDADELISGMYGDIMLGGYHYPTRYLDLPFDKRVDVPIGRNISSVSEYISYLAERSFVDMPSGLPDYLTTSTSLRDVLEANIHRDETGAVIHHGIAYPSLLEAIFSFYPLTNDFARAYMSLLQVAPRWSPFLDDRVVDLMLEMPIEYHLRGTVVNRCIARINRSLANIPHSETNVSLDRPFWVHHLGHYLHELKRQVLEDPPGPTKKHGSWPNHEAIIRNTDFVADCLADHEQFLRSSQHIDETKAKTCLRDHLSGADNTYALYGLVSFLECSNW